MFVVHMKENWYFDHTVIPRIFFSPKNNKKKKGIFYTRKTLKSNVQTNSDRHASNPGTCAGGSLFGHPGATRIRAPAVKFPNYA